MRCSPVPVLVITILCIYWADAAKQPILDLPAPVTQCKDGEFLCPSTSAGAAHCISAAWLCDGDEDCRNGSDEAPKLCQQALNGTNDAQSKCDTNSFQCQPLTSRSTWSKCIPKVWVCDGPRDCPHGDDETNCPALQCHPTDEFQCVSDGFCIERRQVCDLTADCKDESDEANCTRDAGAAKTTTENYNVSTDELSVDSKNVDKTSSKAKRKKSKGRRKQKNEKLPVVVDPNEPTCGRDQFVCEKGKVKCVLMVQQCNGDADCADGSDELGCSCMPHEFTCNDRQCVDKFAECNGVVECRDGSDEQQCESKPKAARCDVTKEFNCGDGVCIPNAAVCDFSIDCPNAADEDSHRCFERCQSTCHHQCVRGPQPYCACQVGYKLKPDGINCEDVDECLTPGACSHRCINTEGGYTCNCADDYVLEVSPDAYIGSGQNLTIDDAWFMRSQYELHTDVTFFKQRRSVRQVNATAITRPTRTVQKTFCKARVGGAPDFLVVRNRELLLYNATTHRIKTLQAEQKAPFSVDYHFADGVIVWTDVTEHSVYRASMRDMDRRVKIADSAGVDSVAVDWLHNHVYFTDPKQKTLEVVYLYPEVAIETGKYVKITLVKDNLFAPRAIQLDPEEGWMYWSDWGEEVVAGSKGSAHRSTRVGKIERAGMDGTRREQIWPPVRYLDSTGNALALDTPSEYYIYWVNGLALDRVNQRLYFVDAWNRNSNGGGKLASVRVDGSDYRFIISSAQSLKYVVGITLWQDDIIWADHGGDGVAACNKFRGDHLRHIFGGLNQSLDSIRATPIAKIAAGGGGKKKKVVSDMDMYDVKAVHPLAQRSSKLTDESDCARGTHACSHMCLPTPRNDNLLISFVFDISRHFSTLFGLGKRNGTSSAGSGGSRRWVCACPRTMQLGLDHKTCVDGEAVRIIEFKPTKDEIKAAGVSLAELAFVAKTPVARQKNTNASDIEFGAASAHILSSAPSSINTSSADAHHGDDDDDESGYYIWLLVAIILVLLLIMSSLYCICREPGDDMPVRQASHPHRMRVWQRQMTNRLTDFAAGSGANRSQFKHHRLHSPSISASIAGQNDASTSKASPGVDHHHVAAVSAASIDDDDIVFQDIDLDEGDIIDGPYAKPRKQQRNNSLMPTGSSPLNNILPRLKAVEQEQRKSSASKIVRNGAGTLLSQVRRISYSKRSKASARNPSFDLGPASTKATGSSSSSGSGDQTNTMSMQQQPTYQLHFTPPGSTPTDDFLGGCASSTTSISSSSLVVEDGIPLVTDQA